MNPVPFLLKFLFVDNFNAQYYILGVGAGTWKSAELRPSGSFTIPTGNHSRSFALVIVVVSNGSENYYCGKFALLASENNSTLHIKEIASWSNNYSANIIGFSKVSGLFTVTNGLPEWGYINYIYF